MKKAKKTQNIKKDVAGNEVKSIDILNALNSTYQMLATHLPSDIERLESEIKKEEDEFNNKIEWKKKRLEQLKIAMRDLPQTWSLDKSKTVSQKATGLMNIGQRIRELREKSSLSQAALGARVKKPQSEISKIELGKVVPTDAVLDKIARELKTDVKSITNGAHLN